MALKITPCEPIDDYPRGERKKNPVNLFPFGQAFPKNTLFNV
jgi:hypothetical protein